MLGCSYITRALLDVLIYQIDDLNQLISTQEKSSIIRCADWRPETITVGMPVPGRVLAPTKSRL